MITEAIANLLLLLVGTAAGAVWIKGLIEWDGKVHCDKDRCNFCPYSGNCEHEKQEDNKQLPSFRL